MYRHIYKNQGLIMIMLYSAVLFLLAFPLFKVLPVGTEAGIRVSGYGIYWLSKSWYAVHYWILVIISAAFAGLASHILKAATSTGFLFGLAGLVSLIFIQLSMKNEAIQHNHAIPVFDGVTMVYWIALFCFVLIIAISYLGDKDQQKNNQRKSPAGPAIHINIITKTSGEKKDIQSD
jgi:hypothetical protein